MGRNVDTALRREAVISTRTSIAGKRQFAIWCWRRRLDMSEVVREAIKEYMTANHTRIPEVRGSDPDE
jgi:hypothetical protein